MESLDAESCSNEPWNAMDSRAEENVPPHSDSAITAAPTTSVISHTDEASSNDAASRPRATNHTENDPDSHVGSSGGISFDPDDAVRETASEQTTEILPNPAILLDQCMGDVSIPESQQASIEDDFYKHVMAARPTVTVPAATRSHDAVPREVRSEGLEEGFYKLALQNPSPPRPNAHLARDGAASNASAPSDQFYKHAIGTPTQKDTAREPQTAKAVAVPDKRPGNGQGDFVQAHVVHDGSEQTVPLPIQPVRGEVTDVSPSDSSSPNSRRKWIIAGLTALYVIPVVVTSIVVCRKNGTCVRDAKSGPFTPPVDSGPSAILIDQVYEYLSNITLTTQMFARSMTLNATVTPEAQAVETLLRLNYLNLAPDTPSSQFRWMQRYALASFLASQEISLYGDECFWSGVECRTVDFGQPVGMQNVAVKLNLSDSNLMGAVSLDMGLLSSLEFFNVSFNALTGTLPYSMGRWSDIEYFSVRSNKFNGSLPDSIQQWTNLRSLDVGSNHLTGTLSSRIGQWTHLEEVSLELNFMGGSIPDTVGQWTNLQSFDVFANRWLTGSLPSTVGLWTNLTYADFAWNHFSGTLPESIGQWSKVDTISLMYNLLTGTLPSSMRGWTALQRAYFQKNNFTGEVPDSFCNAQIAQFDVPCECCQASIIL